MSYKKNDTHVWPSCSLFTYEYSTYVLYYIHHISISLSFRLFISADLIGPTSRVHRKFALAFVLTLLSAGCMNLFIVPIIYGLLNGEQVSKNNSSD